MAGLGLKEATLLWRLTAHANGPHPRKACGPPSRLANCGRLSSSSPPAPPAPVLRVRPPAPPRSTGGSSPARWRSPPLASLHPPLRRAAPAPLPATRRLPGSSAAPAGTGTCRLLPRLSLRQRQSVHLHDSTHLLDLIGLRLAIAARLEIHDLAHARSAEDVVAALDVLAEAQPQQQAGQVREPDVLIGLPAQHAPQDLLPLKHPQFLLISTPRTAHSSGPAVPFRGLAAARPHAPRALAGTDRPSPGARTHVHAGRPHSHSLAACLPPRPDAAGWPPSGWAPRRPPRRRACGCHVRRPPGRRAGRSRPPAPVRSSSLPCQLPSLCAPSDSRLLLLSGSLTASPAHKTDEGRNRI